MKVNDIISGVKNIAGRAFLQAKAHSPEILLVVGVGGLIAGTVLACKATLKAQKVKEEYENTLQEINDIAADESIGNGYTEEDAAKDKLTLTVQTGVKMTGLYAPSFLLCGCSIACILLAHKIMSDRTASAIAFGNAAMAALSETRLKIAEKYGKEAEEEIRYGLTKVKSVNQELYSETDGSGKPIDDEEIVAEIDGCSPYARFIDRECGVWDKNADLILMTLKGVERDFNNTLIARCSGGRPGYVFLSEVLQRLGIPRKRWPKDAAMVGWLYDKNNGGLHNYIDFGPLYRISKIDDGCKDIVVEQYEKAVLIDFNIDGIIYDRL